MKISALGTAGRGNLEIAGLREAFLSHLGFQSLWVVPRGKGTMWRLEGTQLALQLSRQVRWVTALHGVCVPWQCGSVGARLLTNPLCCILLPCKRSCAFCWGSCDTEAHRHSVYVTGLEEGGKKEREACTCFLWETGWKIPGCPRVWCLWSASNSVGSTGRWGSTSHYVPAHRQP